ncbi:diaminopimelate decarboxylase [Oceanicella actignis]|uniref:Diaminopimelate decarboxylase n=1 Tax=Oceanicella actignis TaxID=1189325 RepID=A0A1M7SP90_9RHOB|nr:diaminopimelate decarboxylase [Oceanicella actignis]TYO90867.1 diaminopimelate decarboxylase [Oceanicella actignis]SES65141.1 diaminopimelate decarboxylase [Oceanicella actignis]SHN60226.1 diaminopimelate decarboxylase [Oceanicella actignis]
MDHFNYREGVLHAEDVSIPTIAEQVGTPFYVYSTATLTRHFNVFDQALADLPHLICYAVKANGNLAVLRTLARLGAGMDVVSEGEFRRALAAGVPGDKVVFSGVGKTAAEMRFALANGVRQFNVESAEELEALDAVAREMGVRAPIALRVNPDVDARTHAKIATGKAENKFGVPISAARQVYARAAAMEGIEVVGVDVHIGSQLTDLAPFEAAFRKVAELTEALRADGHDIRRLDLGGGLGIPYRQANEAPPLPFDYGALVRRTVGHLGCEIEVEPGRLIAGNAGLLVASVIYRKQGEGREFLILDAAMNDLIRPAMYDAWHDIAPVIEPAPGAERRPVDVVGPVCETGDTFARDRALPFIGPGELVAFRSAGAYGAAMASEYNSRPLVPEVLVDGDQFAVVRRRPTFEEMLARDTIPSWLA